MLSKTQTEKNLKRNIDNLIADSFNNAISYNEAYPVYQTLRYAFKRHEISLHVYNRLTDYLDLYTHDFD